MVIQRLDLHDRTPYGTAFGTMEIVPLAASRRLWEPVDPTEDVWREWAARRFGKAAADDVISALQESHTILIQGLSCNGIDLLGVGSEFNPRLWAADGSMLSRFYLFGRPGRLLVAPGDGDILTSAQYTAYQMKTRTIAIADFDRNQKQAMEAVTRGRARIERAKATLTTPDYEMLAALFDNASHVLTAVQLLGRAAYAANLLLDNFDRVQDPAAQYRDALRKLDEFLAQPTLEPEMARNIRQITDNYAKLKGAQG
jgi:hypothetical protein